MTAHDSELVIRAASLYVPIAVIALLTVWAKPAQHSVAAAAMASAWNLVALLAINALAIAAGWWRFGTETALVAGVPADLWIGWSLLWGAAPQLWKGRSLVATTCILVGADIALMPLTKPVVLLGDTWLIGEGAALLGAFVPGFVLGRATARRVHVNVRATAQVIGFAGFLFYVLPSLIFAVTGDDWGMLMARPRWFLVGAAAVAAPAGAMALQAVREFALAGGTPVPLDPPKRLVTSGPYAYVANPLQLSGTLLLIVWGFVLWNPAVVLAGLMAAVFSAGFAAWFEDRELADRYGPAWSAYRSQVRTWLPRWRPAAASDATLYVAYSCEPCSDVGTFFGRRRPAGLKIRPAEEYGAVLERITYQGPFDVSRGVAAIGRALDHLNWGWAVIGWLARTPGIEQVLQLITDAVGGGPRAIPQQRAESGANA